MGNLTTKGFIVEDDLATIHYLRITRVLLDSIAFSLLSDEKMNDVRRGREVASGA